ncbi:Desmethyl-deoxy-podophyllotoxin synthase [Linum grandiflorum]
MDFSQLYHHDYSSANLFFIFITSTFIVILTISATRTKSKLPPGPRKLPVIGNLHQLLLSPLPHRRLRDLASKHGPHFMHLQLGEVPYVVVSSPEAADEILKTHDITFANRPEYPLVTDIIYYGGKNIGLAPYGEYWRQMRKICAVELLSTKRVNSFGAMREEEVSKVNTVISCSAAAGETVDLTRLIGELSSVVTSRAAFGMMKESKKDEIFMKLGQDIADATGKFRVSGFFPSLKFLPWLTGFKTHLTGMHLTADRILEEIIAEHRARRGSNYRSQEEVGTVRRRRDTDVDLVDILLDVQENGEHNLDIPLTTDAIKAVILDMITGGTESSTTVVEWTMSEIVKNPEVMQTAQTEVREVFGEKGSVGEQGLEKLKYLDAVIQESLRLHPPLPLLIPKENSERVTFKSGYEIPPKTKVLINAWAIGRDSRYWAEPERFHPGRFIDRSTDYSGKDTKFIPFGGGRRICPGISFGMAIVKLTLANLLYHFDWKVVAGEMDLDMDERFATAVRRKHSLRLIPVVHFGL